jgi:hypothetical protein
MSILQDVDDMKQAKTPQGKTKTLRFVRVFAGILSCFLDGVPVPTSEI